MELENLQVYKQAKDSSNEIWNLVISCSCFEDVIGKQLCKSADSISANITEGYGRYFYKENKYFAIIQEGRF